MLNREPAHPWAYPSYLYYRYLTAHSGPWKAQLKTFAKAHPDNGRAEELSRRMYAYLSVLPEPTEATINVLRGMIKDSIKNPSPIVGFTLSVRPLEAPSARLAVEQYLREHSRSAELTVSVEEIQRPDPRLPNGPVDYLLWRYEGTDPAPAVDPPAPDVAQAVADLAASLYELEIWFEQARSIATHLGPARLLDLLGVMVHPPPRREPFSIWDWIYRVQFAAAFIIGQIDSGWEGSLRRQALLALARGPLDWTVGAAVLALFQITQEESAAVPDVAALYLNLLRALPSPGAVPYEDVLLIAAMQLPDPPDALRKLIIQMLDARRG